MMENNRSMEPTPPEETSEVSDSSVAHLELREEELRARTERKAIGEVVVRKEQVEVPGRLEVESRRDEVIVEHVPIGRIVAERDGPREEEDGTLVVPVYEEQLVVSKRLVLKEEIRVQRIETSQVELFEETLRRDELVIDDPDGTRSVREKYSTEPEDSQAEPESSDKARSDEGLVDRVMRRVIS